MSGQFYPFDLERTRMNTLSRNLLSLGIVIAGVVAFWLLGESQVPTRPAAQPDPPTVKTIIVPQHTEGITFEVDGVVVPYRQIEIGAQISGRVQFKAENCRVGRAVKQGELLVQIDPQDYELEVQRLSEESNQASAALGELAAEISMTDNQIASAQAQLDIASRQLKRSYDLVERRVSSAAEVDTAQQAELASRDALQSLVDQKQLQTTRKTRLEAAKALSEAILAKAQLALKRTEIRSPIEGVVVSETVEQDGYLQIGNPVVVLQDTSKLDVTCKLQMKQMHWLWQSMGRETGSLAEAYDFPETAARVQYTLGGNCFEWDGIANRYDGGGIDNQTRMIPCRVHVQNPLAVRNADAQDKSYFPINPPTLMTGMFVKVQIDANPPIPLVRLPQESVQPGDVVWIRKDGKLSRRQVTIANAIGDQVIAYQEAGGLQAGDEVVVTPLATPFEGQEVWDIDDLPDRASPGGGGPPGAVRGTPASAGKPDERANGDPQPARKGSV